MCVCVAGGGGEKEKKTGDGTLLFFTWVQHLIKKSQSKSDIRYVICSTFVWEIPHLIWLLKGQLFFHNVFPSVAFLLQPASVIH